MDPLTLLFSLIGLLFAGIGSWYTYLAYKRGNLSPPNDLPAGNSLLLKLLTYVWQYPENGGSQVTWAVKESFVLRGEMVSQQEGSGKSSVKKFGENIETACRYPGYDYPATGKGAWIKHQGR